MSRTYRREDQRKAERARRRAERLAKGASSILATWADSDPAEDRMIDAANYREDVHTRALRAIMSFVTTRPNGLVAL